MTILVFPGQGSQWPGMAAGLLDTSDVFAARLRRCAAAIETYVDWSVSDVLRQCRDAPSLDRVEVVQPVLLAVHLALAELWQEHGLEVSGVVGQSQGEIAAACVAGALTVEDAARIIVMRSQLFAERLAGRGGIAAIALSTTAIEAQLAQYGGHLEIAGEIGPRCVTVAGAADALEDLVAQLGSRDIAAKIVPASIPSHCAFVEPLREALTTLLAGVRPRPSRVPIYSTVTAQTIQGTALTADYWYENARRPVLFGAAMRRLLDDGHRVFVESSAHPVLTGAMTSIAESSGYPAVITSTLRRGMGGLDRFLAARSAVRAGLGVALPAASAA